MIADRESFTDLTVHLKRASDALLRTAQHLASLCRAEAAPDATSGPPNDAFASASSPRGSATAGVDGSSDGSWRRIASWRR